MRAIRSDVAENVRRIHVKNALAPLNTPYFNMPPVIKSDGEQQAFNVHKLRGGLMRATQKRPVDAKSIDRAILDIQKRRT